MKKYFGFLLSFLVCMAISGQSHALKLKRGISKPSSGWRDSSKVIPGNTLTYWAVIKGQTVSLLAGFCGDNDPGTTTDFGTVSITGSSDLVVTSDTCSGITVNEDACCTVGLTFTPSSVGAINSNVNLPYSVNHNVPNVPPTTGVEITYLKGEGIDPSKPPVCSRKTNGSIIRVDSSTLGEAIPLVGIPFELVYSSEFAQDFDSSVKIPKNSFFNPELWVPSIQHFYKSSTKTLYLGSGTSTTSENTVLTSGNFLVVSPNGEEVYIFDSNGKHLETKTSLTGATKYSFGYDSANKLATIQDAFGNQTTLIRNGSGILTGIQGPYGQLTTISVNGSGLISTVTNPNSESYQMSYKTGTELLETFTNPLGQVATLTYGADGRLTKDEGAAGNFTSLLKSILTTGEDISESTQMGRVKSHEKRYYPGGKYIVTTTNASTVVETYTEFGDGRFRNATSLLAQVRTIGNDERFGVLHKRKVSESVYMGGGVERATTYSQTFNPSTLTDLFTFNSVTNTTTTNSEVSTNVYTSSTKTWVNTSTEGQTVTTVLDSYERPVSYQIGSDTATTFTYDTNGRLQQSTQGTANTLTYTYNTAGYLQKIKNVRNEETSFVYDLAGRVTQVTLPDTRTISYDYDANGNRTGVTPPGKPKHSLMYNLFQKISKYLPPVLSGVVTVDTEYTYNLDKQLTKILRPTGAAADYIYNATTGLLTSIQTPLGNYTYSYDAGMDVVRDATSPDGIRDHYTYYGYNVKSDAQYTDSTSYLNGKVTYTFNTNHRVASRIVQGNSSATTYTTNYTYNNDGMPTQIGSMNLVYSYPSGRLSTTTVDNVSDSRTYDTYGNLASYTAVYNPTSGSPTTLYSYTLTRDNGGRITAKSETVLGVTDNYDYTYDTAGRLTEVKKNSVVWSSYVYDNNGNRTSGLTAGTAFTATYDDQDRMLTYNTRVYTYNANGDLTQINWGTAGSSYYTFDVFGYLSQATLTTGKTYYYQYDTARRRVRKAENTTQKFRFVYDAQDRVAISVSSGTIYKDYVYGINGTSPEYMNSYISDIGRYRIIKDHLGSPRLVVNTATGVVIQRMDYNDLGEVTADTNGGFQPYGFAGGIYDGNTKLVKFGAREYDPRGAGRWMTKDPILFEGEDANLYGYVQNDPINFVDPSGLVFEGIISNYLTPNQQAVVGTIAAAIGARMAISGVLSLNPALGVFGGILAYEGVQNAKYAKERGLELPGIPGFNEVRNGQNGLTCEALK